MNAAATPWTVLDSVALLVANAKQIVDNYDIHANKHKVTRI